MNPAATPSSVKTSISQGDVPNFLSSQDPSAQPMAMETTNTSGMLDATPAFRSQS